jgi:hypothetical protein
MGGRSVEGKMVDFLDRLNEGQIAILNRDVSNSDKQRKRICQTSSRKKRLEPKLPFYF